MREHSIDVEDAKSSAGYWSSPVPYPNVPRIVRIDFAVTTAVIAAASEESPPTSVIMPRCIDLIEVPGFAGSGPTCDTAEDTPGANLVAASSAALVAALISAVSGSRKPI